MFPELLDEVRAPVALRISDLVADGPFTRNKWPFVSGILLAAGEGTRMGGKKLLLPFGDTTVAGAALRALVGSQVAEVVVVLGHEAETVREGLTRKGDACVAPTAAPQAHHQVGKPLRFVVNTHYKEGMFSSILCGLQAANPDAEGFLISLADMPGVSVEVIDALLAAFRSVAQDFSPACGGVAVRACHSGTRADLKVCATISPGEGIVVPTYQGRRGHPMLFQRRYEAEIRGLDPQIGLRGLLSRHPDEVLEVPVDCPGAVRDIDYWEDYLAQRPY